MIATFSSFGILSHCIGPAALPRCDRETEAAKKGSVKHDFLFRSLKHGREKALAETPKKDLKTIGEIRTETLPDLDCGREIKGEIAFALDLKTGYARILGEGIDRDYPSEPYVICGTADLVAPPTDSMACVVGDYKTRVTMEACDSWQLRLIALACSSVFQADEYQCWLFDLSGGQHSQYTYDDVELGKHLRDARRIYEKALFARSIRACEEYVKGDHCKYCPSFYWCPAKSGDYLSTLPDDLSAASGDQIRESWYSIKLEEKRIAEAKKTIEELIRRRPVDVGDDKVLASVETTRRTMGEEAIALLRSDYPEVANDAIVAEEKVTMESLKKAFGSSDYKEVIEKLEEKGALRASTFTSIREIKRR